MRIASCALLMSGVLATCFVAAAISAPPPPIAQSDQDERERMRMLLERRLHAIEADRADVLAAIDTLDAGAPMDALRDAVRDLATDRRAPIDEAQRAEFRARAVQILEEINPELFQRWRQLQERDPERAEMLRNRMMERMESDGPMRELVDLLDRNPEQFKIRAARFALERQAWKAARTVVEAKERDDEAAAMEARDDLRSILHEQFEKRIEEQRMSLQDAQDRLEQMEARLDDQIARRDALINARIEVFLERASNRPPRHEQFRRPPPRQGDSSR